MCNLRSRPDVVWTKAQAARPSGCLKCLGAGTYFGVHSALKFERDLRTAFVCTQGNQQHHFEVCMKPTKMEWSIQIGFHVASQLEAQTEWPIVVFMAVHPVTPDAKYPLVLGYHVDPLLKKEVFTLKNQVF